jgi:hypothetical protein
MGAMEVAQCPEGLREVVHRVQGVGVVVALYLPAGGRGLLKQVTGATEIAQGSVGHCEVAHRGERGEVMGTEPRRLL